MQTMRSLRNCLLLFPVTALLLAFSASAALAAVPRPEHPRPDAMRDNWMTLNGQWEFEIDRKADGCARGLISGKVLASKIVVPFCPESKLSGLGLGNREYFTSVWYRRTAELPESMKGKRILLHFGGVDYKTWVYVNGKLAGTHTGENAAFCFEITSLLRDGPNELVVRVFDDLRSGLQVGGKQAFNKSEGCVYTRTTGIWQPVWLEAVGSSFVENISVVPDPDHDRVLIEATVNGADPDVKLTAVALAGGKPVGSDAAVGTWRNQRLVVNLSEKKLWEPGSPFLYDLKLTLTRGNETIDELKSYFGLRKVTIEGRRILINGKPVFQRLILDQGFYPDGVWTAPSDEALKHDIEMSMACGYNGAPATPEGIRAALPLLGRQAGLPGLGRVSQLGFQLPARGLCRLCYRVDGSAAPRPQPSGDYRLVSLQRDRFRRVRDSAGDLERDQGCRSNAPRAGKQRLVAYLAAPGGPRFARLRRQSGVLAEAMDGLLRRGRATADAFALRSCVGLVAGLRGAVHDQRNRRDRLGNRGRLGLRRGSRRRSRHSTRDTGARSTPCWTIRTCSGSVTRN